MNKLEKYKKTSSVAYAEEVYDGKDDSGSGFGDFSQKDLWTNRRDNYVSGFDAAIALDLPVKFAEWKDENWHKHEVKLEVLDKTHVFDRNVSMKQLYQYWIDNIYKPE